MSYSAFVDYVRLFLHDASDLHRESKMQTGFTFFFQKLFFPLIQSFLVVRLPHGDTDGPAGVDEDLPVSPAQHLLLLLLQSRNRKM